MSAVTADALSPRSALASFHPAVAAWFERELGEPTACQAQAWAAIASGRDVLIAAPTGSGKTLAAFLSALDALVREGLGHPLPDATRVLYVSPLKALSNDIQLNLQRPLMGIADCLNEQGLASVGIRTMVRTGDTPPAAREAMRRTPPHVLVTTPESLFILLTSEGGRRILGSVQTAIVDEIHAVASSKRGAHLALSLERLEALTGRRPTRIGLSATQNPIAEVARFLVGAERVDAAGHADCAVVDTGHARARDLALELPDSPLEALMSGEVWGEVYDRLAALITAHQTTLVFVNTRRLAERAAHALSERLGDSHVTSHHGSLAKEQRLDAEQRLKRGELKALVATASLELGIDIGDVDLVCQLGSPHTIAAFLQRVGRSGHAVTGTPKGRLFPLSRDDLVECAALLDAARRGELDRLQIPSAPLDVLAQQIVAMCAVEPWQEQDLLARVRAAWPYRGLEQHRFRALLRMLAEGFATRRGRRGAYLFRDAVNGVVRGRRGARLTAMTNGGAIPDNADFDVVLEPDGLFLGTLNEDFAIESSPGDIFQLGNSAWRVLRIEAGKVRVEDANGQPPTIPFWLGEAPGRSDTLSAAVSRLRTRIASALEAEPGPRSAALRALNRQLGLDASASEQLVDYLTGGLAALGSMPTQQTVVFERFFDQSGGMQLVIHSCFGSRINKAWGLALRKRFCRAFNFELQAAANEDTIVLSLGETHSFSLAEVSRYLDSSNVREVLIQALLDAPVFDVRWRWNANIALAVQRFRAGKKVPPQIQRMQAEDLVAVAFPDQIACLENLAGPRRVPEHPLVQQTVHDALTEAMDIDGLERLIAGIERGELEVQTRDLTEPSLLAAEILVATPYMFLDDAPAEERRTRAVSARRHLDSDQLGTLGRIDPAAIERVRAECRPSVADADELHDLLVMVGCAREQELEDCRSRGPLDDWLRELTAQRRAGRCELAPTSAPTPTAYWVAAERWFEFARVHADARPHPQLVSPPELRRPELDRDGALVELARARLQLCGPITAARLADDLCVDANDARLALAMLETEGVAIRGRFSALDTCRGEEEWCERRLLARIHRYSVRTRREAVRPVSRSTFMRFLIGWQHLGNGHRVAGASGLARVLERLEGVEAPAASWEAELLPARMLDFEPALLDQLCLSGRCTWLRITRPGERCDAASSESGRPLRSTPIAILDRAGVDLWTRERADPSPDRETLAGAVLAILERDGACFFDQLLSAAGAEAPALESALAALVGGGWITCDGFAGLRALIRGRRLVGRRGAATARPRLADAGRWSLVKRPRTPRDPDRARLRQLEQAERLARVLLLRYGVLFKRLLAREPRLVPWRDLLRALHRLEARGEIRGGRFVDGFAGEQFAHPDAIDALRAARGAESRAESRASTLICVPASDPVNLTGIVTLGPRIASRRGNRILYRSGVPIAARIGRELEFLTELDDAERWRAHAALHSLTPRAPGEPVPQPWRAV